METLKISSLGPIEQADIRLGDLTILVGPQASGKSILLQLIKLIVDKKYIRRSLEQYGFSWGKELAPILNRFFGDGMASIWSDDTRIIVDGKPFTKSNILPKSGERIADAASELFYIPAQRVVCFENGWPRFFSAYEDSVPYVLREFSEQLRLQQEALLSEGSTVFPKPQQLKDPLRKSFEASIFHNGKIVLDTTIKKQFKMNVGNTSLPFMAWSAGQKEFLPLLLSFYWLCPSSKASKKADIKYVVLEEPEMGLHPGAIKSVILQIIDLMSRGYKVIVSTHSPMLLEFAWAFKYLKEAQANDSALCELFDLKNNAPVKRLFEGILDKVLNTYYFEWENNSVKVKDISTLDAGSDDPAIAEWGGISNFATHASDIVAKYMANGKE